MLIDLQNQNANKTPRRKVLAKTAKKKSEVPAAAVVHRPVAPPQRRRDAKSEPAAVRRRRQQTAGYKWGPGMQTPLFGGGGQMEEVM